MSSDFKAEFRVILERIFNNWQNLRLAVEHGMGGRNGQQVAIQIMDYIYEYCISKKNVTNTELQDVLEDLMDQEFNTVCEDNSIPEICHNLLRYKAMLLNENTSQIKLELDQLPQGKEWLRPDVKIVYTPVAADSSDEESSEDSEGDTMDVDDDDDDDDDDKPTNSRITRSQVTTKKQDQFVEPEPGWTTVRSCRRK